jgi:hypothetical protein
MRMGCRRHLEGNPELEWIDDSRGVGKVPRAVALLQPRRVQRLEPSVNFIPDRPFSGLHTAGTSTGS